MVKTDETQKILRELETFTGTTKYYRSSLGLMLLTEGMHYMRERTGGYWLVSLVESYQPALKKVPFQLWSVQVWPNRSATVEVREDKGLDALIVQNIAYTDFKLKMFDFYVVDRVAMLRSEY